MPDVSIMIELCDILSINVNELLSGERLSEENYREKANENIVSIYQSIEVGVNYDERIVQCEITENEITYKVNGLSIIHTEREIVIYR